MKLKLQALLLMMQEEMNHAEALHGPMRTHHEAFGVLLEEVYEYFDEVRNKEDNRNLTRMRTELLQIAAVALRAALHLT